MASLLSVSIIFFFVASLAIDTQPPSRSEVEIRSIYQSWLVKHGKAYKTLSEEDDRFNVFKDNLKYIDQHNSNKNATYKLGLTVFADLTNEEYRNIHIGNVGMPPVRRMAAREITSQRQTVTDNGEDLPEKVDWREKGAVARVKIQLACNGCWAFSTVAAIEGINKIKTGKLLTLSEQQLLDCDRDENAGCNGGVMDFSLVYLSKKKVGLHTEEDYPFIGKNGQCKLPTMKNGTVATITGLVNVNQSELALKKAVAQQPCTASIDVMGKGFQHYKSGIVTGECGYKNNHAVAVVGYGTENGIDYWLAKNSWGPEWGEEGFVRIQRNVPDKFGKCGITLDAAYPLMDH